MRRMTTRILLTAALVAAAAGCASVDPIEAPNGGSGSADFTRLAAIGNSLTAGYQSGGLIEARQRQSFPAMVARQMGKQVLSSASEAPAPAVDQFVIPGYGSPGSAGMLRLVSLSPVTIEAVPAEAAGSPVNLTYPAPYNNLGVPGATLHDISNTVSSAANPFFGLVLRNQGTVLQMTGALQPTFILLWIGNNDVLGAVTAGDPARLTPVVDFEREYGELIETLLAGQTAMPPTSPGMVVANLPSVTDIPFVTTIPPAIPNPLTGGTIPLLGPDGPLGPGDYVLLPAQTLIAEGYGFAPPNGKGPLPGSLILTASEAAIIQDRVETLNAYIEALCVDKGIPLVDINGLLSRLNRGQVVVGGIDYDSSFILGGAFSLDGVHPTDMGYAIIANEFIKTINRGYGASLAEVDLASVMGISFGAEPVSKVDWRDLDPDAMRAMFDSPLFRVLRGER